MLIRGYEKGMDVKANTSLIYKVTQITEELQPASLYYHSMPRVGLIYVPGHRTTPHFQSYLAGFDTLANATETLKVHMNLMPERDFQIWKCEAKLAPWDRWPECILGGWKYWGEFEKERFQDFWAREQYPLDAWLGPPRGTVWCEWITLHEELTLQKEDYTRRRS